ncbi:MAG: hypothetical protein PQJ60_10435 [Spirochaetales bacterium]|nr:hypothetical protein [Spirochaetales bacterium]
MSTYRILLNRKKALEVERFILKGILSRPSRVFFYFISGDFLLQKLLPFLAPLTLFFVLDSLLPLNPPERILLFSMVYLILLSLAGLRSRRSGEIVSLPCYKGARLVGGIRIALNRKRKKITLVGIYVDEEERGRHLSTALLYGCYLFLEREYGPVDFRLGVHAPLHGATKNMKQNLSRRPFREVREALEKKLPSQPSLTWTDEKGFTFPCDGA